jgi:hypothetical protein
MRTQGSLRLILNTKLWAQMQIDKASEKSIRITAMDTEDQGVKVFLISVSIPSQRWGLSQTGVPSTGIPVSHLRASQQAPTPPQSTGLPPDSSLVILSPAREAIRDRLK